MRTFPRRFRGTSISNRVTRTRYRQTLSNVQQCQRKIVLAVTHEWLRVRCVYPFLFGDRAPSCDGWWFQPDPMLQCLAVRHRTRSYGLYDIANNDRSVPEHCTVKTPSTILGLGICSWPLRPGSRKNEVHVEDRDCRTRRGNGWKCGSDAFREDRHCATWHGSRGLEPAVRREGIYLVG